MKKFTKICLSIALVTFLIGCLLGCVGTMLGGFRQLEHVSIRQLKGIPFRFVRSGSGTFFGFWDDWEDEWDDWEDEWEEYWEWDSSDWKSVETSDNTENKDVSGKEKKDAEQADLKDKNTEANDNTVDMSEGMETGITANRLRKLEIAAGSCQLYIKETSDDQMSISITGECEDHYRYRIKDGDTFMLIHEDMKYGGFGDSWNRSHPKGNTKIMLYLPEKAALDEINIDFGAGKLETGYLRARKIEIEVGAGECIFEGLEAAESVDLSVGAGKIVTETLISRETELDIAAGELQINDAKVTREAKVGISMGNAVLNGTFSGEIDVECSMGNVDITLEGAETDYNYEVDCGMGSVKIDGRNYNSLTDREIYNGRNDIIEISCSMGTVNVNFTR